VTPREFRRETLGELKPDGRGHLFERSVENDMPVLRCMYGDCGFIWWPDEHKPSRECRSEMAPGRTLPGRT
jgi:hypothetical protein